MCASTLKYAARSPVTEDIYMLSFWNTHTKFDLNSNTATTFKSRSSGMWLRVEFHGLHPEEGDSKTFRNDGNIPQDYMASQLRRPQLESSRLWKP